jgi:hypothetical protein
LAPSAEKAKPQAKGGTNIHGELNFLYLINQIILPTFDSAAAQIDVAFSPFVHIKNK